MKEHWEDATSYSRNDKDRTPRTWELKLNGFRISVTRHIHYPKDQWLLLTKLHDYVELENKDIEFAKVEAVETVKKTLRDIADELP